MANSIDDMLKNQLPPKKKSGAKVIIIILIFLLILAAVAAVFVYMYFMQKNQITPKQYFLQYVGKGNLDNVLNLEKMEGFYDRLQNESAEAQTEITANISSGLIENEIDISELKLEIDSKNDPNKVKNSSDVLLTYKGNEVVSLNVLSDKENIGIFSEDIIVKYIGSKYSNLLDLIGKISGEETDIESLTTTFDLEQLSDIQLEMPKFSNNILDKYGEIINQKIPVEQFVSKPITLERSTEKINVTEYSVSINESQAIEVLDLLLQTLENDDELLNAIFDGFGASSELLKENLKSEIEVFINSLYENTPDDTRVYTIKVYGANNITYKVALDFNNEYTVDIDYSYGEDVNEVEITVLEVETQTGFSIDIVKTSSDFSENLDLTVNIINDSEIVGKINLNYDLVVSGNSYTLKCKIDANFMIFSAGLQLNSDVNFKQVQIENLTEDNCLFLDELDKDTLDDIIQAIAAKATEVINNNLKSQGIKTEEEEEGPAERAAVINTEALKETAKTKLINAISEAMGKAQEEGKTFGLIDLTTLEIPDSSFTVSLDGDIAILNIDGFEFKLNSDFQLYE